MIKLRKGCINMKKIILTIIAISLFLPIMTKAEECENNNIKIESINLNNKTEYVEEISPATTKKDKITLLFSI